MPLSDITPRTWVDGAGDLTDVNFNTEIRDSYNLLLNPPAVAVRRSTNQTITSSTWTGVTFDTLIFDTLLNDTPQWSSGTNPTRLTCQVDGWYEVIASGEFGSLSARGMFLMSIRYNGVTSSSNLYHGSGASTNGTSFGALDLSCKNLMLLNATDYIELYLWQNSGANATLSQSFYSPVLSMIRRRGLL